MLVLTRLAGENIIMGEHGEYKIRILTTKSNGVKIGIEAPKHIPVDREEVYNIKQRAKEKEKVALDK